MRRVMVSWFVSRPREAKVRLGFVVITYLHKFLEGAEIYFKLDNEIFVSQNR